MVAGRLGLCQGDDLDGEAEPLGGLGVRREEVAGMPLRPLPLDLARLELVALGDLQAQGSGGKGGELVAGFGARQGDRARRVGGEGGADFHGRIRLQPGLGVLGQVSSLALRDLGEELGGGFLAPGAHVEAGQGPAGLVVIRGMAQDLTEDALGSRPFAQPVELESGLVVGLVAVELGHGTRGSSHQEESQAQGQREAGLHG
ncbi:hypothetical protein D3C87_1287970 [compost metagenome]